MVVVREVVAVVVVVGEVVVVEVVVMEVHHARQTMGRRHRTVSLIPAKVRNSFFFLSTPKLL